MFYALTGRDNPMPHEEYFSNDPNRLYKQVSLSTPVIPNLTILPDIMIRMTMKDFPANGLDLISPSIRTFQRDENVQESSAGQLQ
jgi:hypothetical protein